MARFRLAWTLGTMPWKETAPMNEWLRFVAAMPEAEESFTEQCERFGISRKQGDKWKERGEAGGEEALVDRSRATRSHPHAVSTHAEELLVNDGTKGTETASAIAQRRKGTSRATMLHRSALRSDA